MRRGTVRIAHELRSFLPCGESHELWLVPTPELRDAARSLGSTPGAPIYVELRGDIGPPPATGFGAEYPAQLLARELLRAAPAAETHGCAEDLRGIAFRAAGNEPFWSLEVAAGRLLLRRLGHPDRVRPVGPARETARGWHYATRDDAEDGDPLDLELERGACADTMVGTRSSWRAIVTLVAGTRLEGCAWAGEAAP